MKKLFTILAVLFSLSISAQNIHTQSSSHTIEDFLGAVKAEKGLVNGRWADTTAANLDPINIKNQPGAQIITGNDLWLRNSTATQWIKQTSSASGANGTILNDSTFILCNSNGCDTFIIRNIVINNFSIVNDSTILVCDGESVCDTININHTPFNKFYVDSVRILSDTLAYYVNGIKYIGGIISTGAQGSIVNDSTFMLCNAGVCDTFIVHDVVINNFSFLNDSTVLVCNTTGSCDTITFNPVPLSKFYVDSAKIVSGAVDTLFYWINGMKYIGGFVNHLKAVNDGLISGGVVTYSGNGLTYYVSAATYVIGGEFYSSPDTTITLDAADATDPRIDLFAVDTLGHVVKITGIAASTPITPQVDVSQLALTTGITLAPNATQPTGTNSTIIYDENTEWTTGGTATVNFNNTANPYHGTKDAFVSSYSKNSTLTFTGTTQVVNGQILRAFIDLLGANYSLQLRFYNGTTAVSSAVVINGFGFSPTLYNTYQNVSIPLSSFTWSGTSFDRLVITMTGKGAAGTYYIDYISLEGGTPAIPPVDNSSKVDSTTINGGKEYYWINGVAHLAGSIVDSLAYTTLTINGDTTGVNINRPNGTSDFIPLPFVKKTDTSITVISHQGIGLQTIYANGTDTIFAKNLQAGFGIKVVQNTDSSLTIKADTAVLSSQDRLHNDSLSLASNMWKLRGNSGTDSTINFLGTTDNQPLYIKTNNTPKMKIQTTGEVIISQELTPAPSLLSNLGIDRLSVVTNGTSVGMVGISANSLVAGRASFKGVRSRGTVSSPAAVVNGDEIVSFLAAPFDGTKAIVTGRMTAVVDGDVTTDSIPTDLVFTAGIVNQGNGTADEKMRIKYNGALSFKKYGTGLFTTGTAAYNLAVTSSGNIIEVPVTSGSGIESIVAGTNVTVDNTDPLNPVVSATGSGGGTTADSTLTATAGQTAFTFSSVPASYSDYIIFVNGGKCVPTVSYTTSGNVITFTIALSLGDKVNYVRIK